MSIKISEYTTEQTTILNDDKQELSTETAPGVWETRWYKTTTLYAKIKAMIFGDFIETTLGTTDTKVPTSKAVSDAINGIDTPTLQEVTTAGNTTTNNIIVEDGSANQLINMGNDGGDGGLYIISADGLHQTIITPTSIDIDGNPIVASVTGTCVDNTDPANPVVNALALDGSNANSDVDLGTYALNAKSFKVNGTAGNGHLGLKHQSSGASAAASESVIYADSSGNPQWKNDGNAVEQILTSKNVFDIYITTGDQTTTSNVNTGITGLSVSAEANKRYAFDGFIHVGCNNTGGIKFTVTVPSGATLNFGFDAPATPNTSNGIKQFINASGTQTAALCNANSALGIVEVRGEVTIGATAGTIQFGFASSTSGQTSTAYQNGTNIEVKVRG